MSFFENIFQKKKRQETVLLLDIASDGIAGAYVRYEEGKLPLFLYSRKLPIEIRPDESHDRAMIRALDILAKDMISDGSPVLVRTLGKGSIDMILVSVDAPWQETRVRTEHIEESEPFLFTKSLVAKKLEESVSTPDEKRIVDESVVGTILNGYETHNPYGNKVQRASIIVLTSFIEHQVAHDIITTLEDNYHTKNIIPITGGSLRYQAMRAVFPHEDEALILDTTGSTVVSVALIRNGIFVSYIQVESNAEPKAWIATITTELAEIAKHYPLPRTIFLLAREPDISALRDILDTTNFESLWLSDNPPKIVSIMRENMSSLIQQSTSNPTDIILLLMSLYYQNRQHLVENA